MEYEDGMKALLGRALNKNQILILSELQDSAKTITGALNRISKTSGISLSTLKLNAKILKSLGLISYSELQTAELTEFGKAIIKMLG